MPEFRPADTYGRPPLGIAIPADIIGGAGCFADDSDSTYAEYDPTSGLFSECTNSEDFGHPAAGYASGAVRVRGEYLTTDDFNIAVFISDVANTELFLINNAPGPIFPVGSPGWYETPTATFTPTQVAMLAAGEPIYVGVNNFSDAGLRIYELVLILNPGTTRPRVCRVHPRSDGLGGSTVPRLWPPSRSVQGSNRLAGGTYF